MAEIPQELARAVLDGLPYDKIRDHLTVDDMAHALAAVLPLVRRAETERALLAAANDVDRGPDVPLRKSDVVDYLRRRSASFAREAGGRDG